MPQKVLSQMLLDASTCMLFLSMYSTLYLKYTEPWESPSMLVRKTILHPAGKHMQQNMNMVLNVVSIPLDICMWNMEPASPWKRVCGRGLGNGSALGSALPRTISKTPQSKTFTKGTKRNLAKSRNIHYILIFSRISIKYTVLYCIRSSPSIS